MGRLGSVVRDYAKVSLERTPRTRRERVLRTGREALRLFDKH